MKTYYLAVDIGASSGRHILGSIQNGKIVLEEIYRFPNGMKEKDGHLCWNVEDLFFHIKEGMKQCRLAGKIPESMGIDTWAVDFVLLNKEGQILGNAVGYRDDRTRGEDQKVYEIISEEELYRRTGIQKQIFNTVYQLEAIKSQQPKLLEQAETMLMIPDYFHYLLTGVKKQEYTNATTTQLVDPVTGAWDMELIGQLGFPERLFGALSEPGTLVGTLRKDVEEEVGFTCKVVLPATHDTACAVMAVPVPGKEQAGASPDMLYISSGTWSLMGTELKKADCSEESRKRNFTNEGGYEKRFRYLKNIMGLWMIQSLKKEWKDSWSFAQLCELAEQETISSLVDCNDERFLAPESMIEAVQEFCRNSGQQVPQTAGELAAVIYQSLAVCYGEALKELEEMTGHHYSGIHIVGGGANADYLNRLTAKAAGRTVYAGPTEATAIGNLLAQMIRDGWFQNLDQAREAVLHSFPIQTFESSMLQKN